MTILWITEAIPISVTALLPIVLFPFFGIMKGSTVATTYFNNVIFLFIGGFLIAKAMERHNLHKRIALKILLTIGTSYGRVLLGFMFATFFLSGWMSNTATAMMMIPVVISVISKFSDYINNKDLQKISYGLLFGVAYSASIGGIATIIGTPPNLAFIKIFSILYPNAPEITFSQWMIFAYPIAFTMFILTWLLLYFKYRPTNKININNSLFKDETSKLGKIKYEEKIVLSAFILAAILWITRSNITLGNITLFGWSNLLKSPKMVDDGTVAILIALLLFIVPTKDKSSKIIDVNSILSLPWNIILLFGGGFALAKGFNISGLDVWLGNRISFINGISFLMIIFLIVLFMSFLTEFTSNTASTQMFLPILAGIAISTKVNPLLLMIPATVAASLAFMLPVATPPNAIVFGAKKIRIIEMVKTGFWLDLIGVTVVTLGMYFLGRAIFGIEINVIPIWAT